MKIKNLAQLKRAIASSQEYTVVEHFLKPHLTGVRRVPTKVQTNAWYSVVPNNPNHEVSKANGGLGYYCQYGKASDWTFNDDGTMTQHFKGKPIMTIRFDK